MAGNRRSIAATVAALAAVLVLAVVGAGCGDVRDSTPNMANGKALFVAKCGSCHVLARADTKGVTGPDLDAAFAQSLADGLKRSTVKGVVHKQILYPDITGVMPAKIVKGQDAKDVAAYVAYAVARPGKDSGTLANAVAGVEKKTAVERNGRLEIDADPNGQLAYLVSTAAATPGPLLLSSKNASTTPHDIAIQGPGVDDKGEIVSNGGISKVNVKLGRGTYDFFCTVPGHRQAGMEGTITVK